MADMRTVWNADTQEWEYYEIVDVPFVEIRNYEDRFIDGVVVAKDGCFLWVLLVFASAGYGLVELIRWLV